MKKLRIFLTISILFNIACFIGFWTFLSLYFNEKNKPTYQNYIHCTYIQPTSSNKLNYKTFVLKVCSSDGQLVDLMNYQFETYQTTNWLIYTTTDTFNINNTNTLYFYYEYDVKIQNSNIILKDSGFFDLKFTTLNNRQLYYPDITNEVFQNHNMGKYILDNNYNYVLEFRLKINKRKI